MINGFKSFIRFVKFDGNLKSFFFLVYNYPCEKLLRKLYKLRYNLHHY